MVVATAAEGSAVSSKPQSLGRIKLLALRRGALTHTALMRRRSRVPRIGDLDLRDLWRIVGKISGIAGQARNLLHDIQVLALAEDGVSTIQRGISNLGDKELRTVGVRSCIGIGQPPRLIECQIGADLVLEPVARIAPSVTLWIAALDHEIGNHTMENRTVIQWRALHHLAALRIAPLLGSRRQARSEE